MTHYLRCTELYLSYDLSDQRQQRQYFEVQLLSTHTDVHTKCAGYDQRLPWSLLGTYSPFLGCIGQANEKVGTLQ